MRKTTLVFLRYLLAVGMITPQVMQMRFLPKAGRNAAVSCLRRRRERNLIRTWRLYGKRAFYRLTGYGARKLRQQGDHVSRRAHLPLSPTGKRESFALSCFCNEKPESERIPIRPHLDPIAFPRIARLPFDPLHKKRFVRDGDLIHLVVTDGGAQQFLNQTVIPKVCSLLDPTKFPEFVALRDAGFFRLAIPTATVARADELLAGLEENPPPFPAEVIVYPDLIHFLPQLRSNSQHGETE